MLNSKILRLYLSILYCSIKFLCFIHISQASSKLLGCIYCPIHTFSLSPVQFGARRRQWRY